MLNKWVWMPSFFELQVRPCLFSPCYVNASFYGKRVF